MIGELTRFLQYDVLYDKEITRFMQYDVVQDIRNLLDFYNMMQYTLRKIPNFCNML